MQHRHCVLIALTATALAAAGCGRGDEDDAGGGSGGAPAKVAGFDGTTIKLGVVSPLSGPAAVVGKPLTAGNRLWLDYVNAELGGIGGKYKVKLVERDSRADVPTSVQAYNRLKDEVVAFVQLYSTPVVKVLLPAMRKDATAGSPASLDAAWVREPNLMPVSAPYQIQAANAMDYYVRTEGKGGGKKVCTMIEDDAYGDAGQAGVEFAGEQLGFEIAATAKFRLGDKSYTGQITRLSRARCDVVFLGASVSDVGTILGTAAAAKFAPRWIGQSPTWLGALAKSPLKPYLEARFWVVAEGPAWGDESVVGMRDLIARKKQYPPREPIEAGDFYFTFGYIQARTVTTVLEQAVADGDLSKAGILKAVGEVDAVKLDGLGQDYVYGDVATRSPGRESSIFAIDADEPFGLKALETNFSSEAAKEYEFSAG